MGHFNSPPSFFPPSLLLLSFPSEILYCYVTHDSSEPLQSNNPLASAWLVSVAVGICQIARLSYIPRKAQGTLRKFARRNQARGGYSRKVLLYL